MLKGTLTKDKNEIMFENGLNYNEEPEVLKRGTILIRVSGNKKLDKKEKKKEEKKKYKEGKMET